MSNVYQDIREDVRAIRLLLENPPQLLLRGQIRIGEYLLQKWPGLADGTGLIAIVMRDGERRVLREDDIEAALRALLVAKAYGVDA